MYSGTTLTRFSGRILGAHQKFDSVSRRHLTKMGIKKNEFPGIRQILHFEGLKGPDAIKRKSPAKDEPWHYIDPFNDEDTALIELIKDHYDNLVLDIKRNETEKVAFEAAWLAHAIVDGLTPAHHYPYEEKLLELREGQGLETRDSLKNKWLLPGTTPTRQLKNNWKMWGPKGLMTAHGLFEIGIATMIKPLSFSDSVPTAHEAEMFGKHGIGAGFLKAAREIAVLEMYEKYLLKGWTPKLTWQVRHALAPIIIRTITLAWYQAIQDAQES